MRRDTEQRRQPGDVMLWLVIGLPLISWLPLTTLSVQAAMTESPYFVYSVGLLLAVAVWIGRTDWWLGVFVGWHAVALLWTQTVAAFETTELLAMSAVALGFVRALPAERHGQARAALVTMGLFQVVYVVAQRVGFDLFWQGPQIDPAYAGAGTLGGSNAVGFYLAAIAPLAPLALAPLFAAGLLASKCLTGLVAATAGLCWQWRAQWTRWLPMLAAGAILSVALIDWKGAVWTSGWLERVDFWSFALARMYGWQWLIGHGPGAWSVEIPAWQQAAAFRGPELMLQAHNEWMQVLFERGIVGLVCLLGWLWQWRAMFTGRYGGACVAILIGSMTLFGFRLAITGSVLVLLLGVATAEVSARDGGGVR